MIEANVGKDIGVQLVATGSAKDLTNDVLCIAVPKKEDPEVE